MRSGAWIPHVLGMDRDFFVFFCFLVIPLVFLGWIEFLLGSSCLGCFGGGKKEIGAAGEDFGGRIEDFARSYGPHLD